MNNDYPRMLYRPGKGPGDTVRGYRVGTRTVQSSDEEHEAISHGWFADPQKAIKGVVWRKRMASVWRFYRKNWQWLWGILVAVSLAALFHG